MSFIATIDSPAGFGEALRCARRDGGLSQRALAVRAGCSQRLISELERGKPTAELGKALDVMRALGLTMRISSADPAGANRREVASAIARVEAMLERASADD